MKERTASCCCGDLSVTLSGEPERIILYHCDYCQKRTGGVYQVLCWYYGDQIESRSGNPKIFNEGDSCSTTETMFCQSHILSRSRNEPLTAADPRTLPSDPAQ